MLKSLTLRLVSAFLIIVSSLYFQGEKIPSNYFSNNRGKKMIGENGHFFDKPIFDKIEIDYLL